MTVNRLDENKVLVVLGSQDMRDFSLNFEVMGMDDAQSRKIILRLMRLACQRSGIDIRGRRVGVEALMMNEDCYLLVTVKKPSRFYKLKRSSGRGFRFADSTALMNAVEAVYRERFFSKKNSLYERGGKYYLLFEYPALPRRMQRILSEFSDKNGGSLFCAAAREQGRALCRHNAIESLGQYLV